MANILLLRLCTFLSFAWNVSICLLVCLNSSLVLKRAAGGEFDTFPSRIRIIYVFNVLIIIYQVQTYIKLLQRKQVSWVWLPKALIFVNAICVVFNACSRSSLERWNAIPAAIITSSFYTESLYCNTKKSSS